MSELTVKVNDTLIAIRACREDAKGQRGIIGKIECPKCKGVLSYSVAKSNGHLWGACETENCLQWMM